MEMVLAIAVLGLLLLVAGRLERLNTVNPAGAARVADGDTLDLNGERIRLRGIDAPEFNQKCRRQGADYLCGRQARAALTRLTEGREVACRGWERDRYGRLLAVCSAGGVELNRQLVAEGWAVAYGDYEAEEGLARNERRGIWAGDFERPSQWRINHGEVAETSPNLFAAIGDWLRGLFHGWTSQTE